MKFLFSAVYTALLLPLLLRWGKRNADEQIDKMQEAAFNTPGAESPVPPRVTVVSIGFLVSHFVVGQQVFKLKGWQAMLSLLLGLGAGLGAFVAMLGGNSDRGSE